MLFFTDIYVCICLYTYIFTYTYVQLLEYIADMLCYNNIAFYLNSLIIKDK